MITVACVKWGTKYTAHYVRVLADMVARCLSAEHRFVCFTDDVTGLDGIETQPLPGDLDGWWNKIYLFKPGVLSGRVLYLDLDVLCVGDLTDLLEVDAPFAIIKDWWQDGYNSSVMAWDAEKNHDIWEKFEPSDMGRLHGDQDFINEAKPGAYTFDPYWCISYKIHCQKYPPVGAKVICFHGEPKPHEVGTPWVTEVWKIGGAAAVEFTARCNTASAEVANNIALSTSRNIPWASSQLPPHKHEMVLVGGGPSLPEALGWIRFKQAKGAHIWATNGTYNWLMSKNIIPDYFLMADARIENVRFVDVTATHTKHFIASQCHPDVFDALKGNLITLWHAFSSEAEAAMEADTERPWMLVGGGATVLMKGLYLGYLAGYRRFSLIGADSCYFGHQHHAYAQPMNDGEDTFKVVCRDKVFTCSPWQINQAQDFQRQAKELNRLGCRLTVYGNGLLAEILQGEKAA